MDYFIVSIFSHVSMIKSSSFPLVIVVHMCSTRLSHNWENEVVICIYSLASSENIYALFSIWNRDSHAQNKRVIYIAKHVYCLVNVVVCHGFVLRGKGNIFDLNTNSHLCFKGVTFCTFQFFLYTPAIFYYVLIGCV